MLTKPVKWEAAIDAVERRAPKPSKFNSARWSQEKPAVRERGFFSSTIECFRFLQAARDFLLAHVASERELVPPGDGPGGVGMRADGAARFLRDMSALAIEQGLGPVGVPASAVDQSDLTDIRSAARLKLIFRTGQKQAYGYGHYKQGVEDPDILNAYPAWRFVRNPGAKEFRKRHVAATGSVRLKNDKKFWLRQNATDIGGFGVPYGPWGFNSRMDVVNVDRAEAERLGLLSPGEQVSPGVPAFNAGLRASLSGLDPDFKALLANRLGVKIGKSAKHVKATKAAAKRRGNA